jgi:hypothetical protein
MISQTGPGGLYQDWQKGVCEDYWCDSFKVFSGIQADFFLTVESHNTFF